MMTTPNRKERGPRRFWLDARFLIGIGLVVASVLGVVTLVSSADDTVDVLAARAPLAVGDRLRDGDVVAVPVRLGSSTEKYLTRGELPKEGLIVTRTVARGELVPISAVGDEAGVRVASVVITINAQLPQGVVPGSGVDVWAARQTEERQFGPPTVLVASATVVRLIEAEGIMGGDSSVGVELLVPRAKIARVLEAIANADALSLVPVSHPVTG